MTRRRAALCRNQRQADGDGENGDDNGERQAIWNVDEMGRNHLRADKSENECEPRFQINETIDEVREQEVEGTQPENRTDVRRVDDESIRRDREHGWD